MTQEEYLRLYKRYLAGIATPNEIALLDNYKDEFDIDRFDDKPSIPDQDTVKTRIYQRIESRMELPPNATRPVRRLWLWSAAASILLLIGIGFFYTSKLKSKVNSVPVKITKVNQAIVPGTNRAILILDNGTRVDLNDATKGRIAQSGNTTINKLNNGRLQYNNEGRSSAGKSDAIAYNTIITPRGGQYEVMLPDGTSVWLNSASSLKYPVAFAGSERHVELNGEAYFEVAKDKNMPFTVNSGNVNIRVIGTHFNIAAYDDDPSTKTTLLEGSVKLSTANEAVVLTPGQQGVAENGSHNITTKTVNVQDAIAWKNGYFSFKKENIQCAMRKISRWYDVDVVYDGKISDKLISGSVTRTQSITEMLSYLETIGIAKFKIDGRRIMVKAN
ncbi:FecR family protein [Mucilaginibacter sp. JRF]|uniref:FecR family protein n=1 Tax=Mucilaginibacter sp. JRF TaxID=2780088 RepID=UPI001881A5AE|nr:FecR domain-containing protein [Mucilaginibacter sp. JRF]MBE9586648.1 FecR family protein [Mucilaginibacter sp. JRF]